MRKCEKILFNSMDKKCRHQACQAFFGRRKKTTNQKQKRQIKWKKLVHVTVIAEIAQDVVETKTISSNISDGIGAFFFGSN